MLSPEDGNRSNYKRGFLFESTEIKDKSRKSATARAFYIEVSFQSLNRY
jgi:hypothetical protein